MVNIPNSKLAELLLKGESEILEYKSTFSDKALETVGAFANAKGGQVLIGVTDTGLICGLQIGNKTIEDIANKIQEATDPRLQPSIYNDPRNLDHRVL